MESWTLALALVVTTTTSGWARFESNKELSAQARVGMAEAIKTAESSAHGKAVEVSMGKDDGRVVCKIEPVDSAIRAATCMSTRLMEKFMKLCE